MSYSATVFNVMIASPGDVQVERSLVREVIHEWNATHSSSRTTVLQPIGWETHSQPSMDARAQGVLNKQITDDADLLVAIFWTRLGTPTDEAASGTVEEIERHMAAGKPTMIYFSSAPVRLDSVDDKQYRALQEFKERCKENGLIESYDTPTEFRQKFSRQLAKTINENSNFAVARLGDDGTEPEILDRVVPVLTTEAQTLLLNAADDPNGHILHARHMAGVDIQTNGRQFIEPNSPRSRAAWEGALVELENLGLIEDLGHKGEVYQVTRKGYELVETLRT